MKACCIERTEKTPRRWGGFTLIEILVVLAILGVVTAVVAASFSGGVRVWDHVRQFNALEGQAQIGLAIFEKDLRNTFDFPPIGFEGQPLEVSFPGLTREGRMGTIRYYLDPARKALCRDEAAASEMTSPGLGTEALVAHVTKLNLRYFAVATGKNAAVTEVSGRMTNAPSRIVIDLTLSDGRRVVEMARTVVAPAAVVTR